MRILLACGAGLSTSILMKKIEKYCADKGEDLTINAVPVSYTHLDVYKRQARHTFSMTDRRLPMESLISVMC